MLRERYHKVRVELHEIIEKMIPLENPEVDWTPAASRDVAIAVRRLCRILVRVIDSLP